MTGVDSATRSPAGERLVVALIPAAPHRPEPLPVSLPLLPLRPRPASALIFDMARPDASGRVSIRSLLRVLGWAYGHRLDLAIVAGVLIFTPATAGQYAVTTQGSIKLSVTARRLVGISPGEPVLLAACPADDILVAIPAPMVEDWLRSWFADEVGCV